jgi:phage shock protein E
MSNRVRIAIAVIVVVAVAVVGVLAFAPNESDEARAIEPGLISPAEYVESFNSDDHFLLDVRTPEEFASGHIEGAVNIPVEILGSYLDEVPQDQPVVLYCRSGNRSDQAASILRRSGYSDVYDIDGGVIAWTNQNRPLQ